MRNYAADVFAALVLGCMVFLAFSLAANSCFTFRATASVSTLYTLAASRTTVSAFVRDAARKMLVSISSRESVPSSTLRR